MKNVTTKSRRQGGFSLVELVVAMSVIAIALVGILATILHTSNASLADRQLALAKQAAAGKLEEFKAQTVAAGSTISATLAGYALAQYGGATAGNITTSTFTVSELSLGSFWTPTRAGSAATLLGRGTIRIDGTNANLTDLQVTIDWKGPHGAASQYVGRGLYTK